jgi:ferric-dicitrate binding protein FerR (iron transport regulator)
VTTRADELWTRHLEARLSAAEEDELLRVMEADPVLRERLLDDRELDGLLHAACANDAEAFERAFRERLAVEKDGSRFVARVERRVRRRPASRSSGWLPFAAAAGLFVAISLIALAFRPKPAPPRMVERPAPIPRHETVRVPERPTAPEPPAPVPPEVPEAPKPAPEKKEPVPTPPPPPEPSKAAPGPEKKDPPPPPPPPATKAAVATILKAERPNGEVSELPAGASLEGAAKLTYLDGTRMELDGAVSELQEAPKILRLSRGTLTADVVRQAQPMLIRTPHAEARVLGTSFKLTVEADATRLEVTTGKVRLTRLADGKFVDVPGGRSARSSEIAVKPRPTLLSETFEAGVETRWTSEGSGVKAAGRLEIDLGSRAPEGWSGGGLKTRQAFAAPFAASMDVDIPLTHDGIVTAVVFIPAGGKRKDAGVLRLQLRGARYSLMTESGEPRELAGANRSGSGPCRERWRVELRGSETRVFVNDRELFRHTHDLPAAAGYSIQLDGSARPDAPAGAKTSFDAVVVEALRP